MIWLLLSAALAVEPLHEGWPLPIHDSPLRGMLLVDQLEYSVPDLPGAVGTDIEGWLGGDRDRLRYRAEGDVRLVDRAWDGELGAAYSRLVGPWMELQLGLGLEAQDDGSAGMEARLEAGVEAVVPYDFDVEALVRVSHRGRASLRVSAIKEFLFAQRLVLQLRADGTGAVQQSAELDTPRGLEAVSAEARLRYEIRRELAPYVGVSWSGGMAGPSGAGGFAQEVTAVGGLRTWF